MYTQHTTPFYLHVPVYVIGVECPQRPLEGAGSPRAVLIGYSESLGMVARDWT